MRANQAEATSRSEVGSNHDFCNDVYSMEKSKLLKEFTKGIKRENPVLGLALGLCPTLAVSISIKNGLGMGCAATFVLICSNIIISSIRKVVPEKIRIPCFIVVIATFVTIVELFMKGFAPGLSKALGIFVPLIVVNCIIMGRAEVFASRHSVMDSIFDGLGMGFGFTFALVLISVIREILGSGTIWGIPLFLSYEPALIMIFAPGAFLVLAFLIGLFNLKRK